MQILGEVVEGAEGDDPQRDVGAGYLLRDCTDGSVSASHHDGGSVRGDPLRDRSTKYLDVPVDDDVVIPPAGFEDLSNLRGNRVAACRTRLFVDHYGDGSCRARCGWSGHLGQ